MRHGLEHVGALGTLGSHVRRCSNILGWGQTAESSSLHSIS